MKEYSFMSPRGANKDPARIQQGSNKDPTRIQQGSSKGPARTSKDQQGPLLVFVCFLFFLAGFPVAKLCFLAGHFGADSFTLRGVQ